MTAFTHWHWTCNLKSTQQTETKGGWRSLPKLHLAVHKRSVKLPTNRERKTSKVARLFRSFGRVILQWLRFLSKRWLVGFSLYCQHRATSSCHEVGFVLISNPIPIQISNVWEEQVRLQHTPQNGKAIGTGFIEKRKHLLSGYWTLIGHGKWIQKVITFKFRNDLTDVQFAHLNLLKQSYLMLNYHSVRMTFWQRNFISNLDKATNWTDRSGFAEAIRFSGVRNSNAVSFFCFVE